MSELSEQDIDAIERIHNCWINEELAGNSSQVIELCTNDVMWIPPNAPPLEGKEAIAHYLYESSVEIKNIDVTEVVIRGSGSVAYLTSRYQCRFAIEGQTEIQETTGAHLWVLRKAEGGTWQVAIVSWSLFSV